MKWLTGMGVAGALATASLFGTAAHAANLSVWTFEVSVPATAGPHAAEGGTVGGSATGSHASGAVVYSNPAGNASSESFSSNNWASGDYYQFQTSSLGESDIGLSFDQTGSNTGPRDFKVQYSTDGAVFTDFASYSITNDSWSSAGVPKPESAYSFDLSSIVALNNQANIYFRLTADGTISINGGTVATAGTGRVDNVTILSDIPEPASLALLGIGGLLVGLRRRSA